MSLQQQIHATSTPQIQFFALSSILTLQHSNNFVPANNDFTFLASLVIITIH